MRYRVKFVPSVEYIDVEADNEEEAEERAYEQVEDYGRENPVMEVEIIKITGKKRRLIEALDQLDFMIREGIWDDIALSRASKSYKELVNFITDSK